MGGRGVIDESGEEKASSSGLSHRRATVVQIVEKVSVGSE